MEKNNKNNIINFPNKKSKLEKEIEAIIFAAEEPLDIETIEERVGTRTNIKKILENLQKEYTGRGINLVCISNKCKSHSVESPVYDASETAKE